jgi:hypothetical protein
MDTSFSPVGGFEAGRWKHVGAGIFLLQKRPMPLCHSGGNAAQDREADLRRRVGRIASTFLDGRTWHEVLDFEQGRKAFFYGRPQRLPASRTWARMALRKNCLNRPKDRPRRCRRISFLCFTNSNLTSIVELQPLTMRAVFLPAGAGIALTNPHWEYTRNGHIYLAAVSSQPLIVALLFIGPGQRASVVLCTFFMWT